ncbi:MAG: serine hydrolase domain-containing protein [Candidatus Thorarchaeota archaeon]
MFQRPRILVFLVLSMLFLLSAVSPAYARYYGGGVLSLSLERDYWPTEEWQTSDPLNYDIDTTFLEAMMEEIEDTPHNVHSVLIVKSGYIVWEEYPRSIYNPTRLHMLQSCTKSFTSTLIGIALHEGFIDNVSQRMVDFFPDRTIANLDSRKESITLYHMLTMSEGMYWTELDYPYTDDRNTLKQMWDSTDAIQHILDQPMMRNPGDEWHYNSGMSVLLGAVLEQVTGQSVEEFAEQYLFDRIGIGNYQWYSMPNSDVLHTDGGLYLSSRDMARLGYLMLNNGTWNGTEIVSSDWVYDATHSDVQIDSETNYGYQWWLFPEYGFYSATGHYEQKIYVIPEEDLVVVFTANIADDKPHPTDRFLLSYVLPSVQQESNSDDGIPVEPIVNLSILAIIIAPLVVAGILQYRKLR